LRNNGRSLEESYFKDNIDHKGRYDACSEFSLYPDPEVGRVWKPTTEMDTIWSHHVDRKEPVPSNIGEIEITK